LSDERRIGEVATLVTARGERIRALIERCCNECSGHEPRGVTTSFNAASPTDDVVVLDHAH
jgi:hypothetical protein